MATAREAHLRYVADRMPGFTRRRKGRGFAYYDESGKPIRDPKHLSRIASLAIPPAYRDVWICPIPNGHLQATARDARGRKQYRYHPRWREHRDEAKFHRLAQFGKALPKLRTAVRRDLAAPGLSRQKVLAAVVALLEMTGARVGNEEYARANGSFGLTTLRSRHVRLRGPAIQVKYRGKTGREHSVEIHDERIARILRRCRDLPGEELFTYIDEGGAMRSVSSEDVNDYIRQVSGQDFSAKDFRTWIGTVECLRALSRSARTGAEAKRFIKSALECAARRLGNTVAVCRKSYVHPGVLLAYERDRALRVRPGTERSIVRFLQTLAANGHSRVPVLTAPLEGTPSVGASHAKKKVA